MASLKDIQLKIVGVKKTEQITKAMNMVAAAKLRGAQSRMEEFRPYAEKFGSVMGELAGGTNSASFPLMEIRENIKKVALVVVTSDRGLCGAFNANIINASEKFFASQRERGRETAAICIGRKGNSYFEKSSTEVIYKMVDCMANIQMFNAKQVGQKLIQLFLDGTIDEAHVIYGRFINVAVQKPAIKRLLPISQEGLEEGAEAEKEGPTAAYIYEPEPEAILNQLMPMFINVQIMHAMLETGASEQAARMTAMDNATRACKDMIENLTLAYNKARQGAITTELMDIVGGAEALKG